MITFLNANMICSKTSIIIYSSDHYGSLFLPQYYSKNLLNDKPVWETISSFYYNIININYTIKFLTNNIKIMKLHKQQKNLDNINDEDKKWCRLFATFYSDLRHFDYKTHL